MSTLRERRSVPAHLEQRATGSLLAVHCSSPILHRTYTPSLAAGRPQDGRSRAMVDFAALAIITGMPTESNMQRGKNPLEQFIFWSRWLQAPLYLGLIVAQGIYVYLFMMELWHLLDAAFSSSHISETETMLVVLGLIDVVMIANLLIMVIVGGYETFVSRLHLDEHPDQPEWLSHVNAGVLKIKLSTAIIGISSIHLLKTFINAANLSQHAIQWQVVIHVVFLFSALATATVDKIMNQTLQMAKTH